MVESNRDQAMLVDHEIHEGEFHDFQQSRRILKLVMFEGLLLVVVFLAWMGRDPSPLRWIALAFGIVVGLAALRQERRHARQDEEELKALRLWEPVTNAISPKAVALGLLTFGLWAATAVLGLAAIGVIITEIWPLLFLALTGPTSPTQQEGLLGFSWYCLLLVLGGVWILVVIGGGEYHRLRIGQPRSWKLFGLTFAVEAVILAAAQLI